MQFIGGILSYSIENFFNNTHLLHLLLFLLSILNLTNLVNIPDIIPIITKANIILKLNKYTISRYTLSLFDLVKNNAI